MPFDLNLRQVELLNYEIRQLQVLASVLKACKEIDWTNIYIPEGRSLKAVQEMISSIRKHAPGANETNSASPANKAASTKGKRKPAGEGTKRKRGKKSDELVVEDDEEDTNVKKRKTSSEDEAKGEDSVQYEMIAVAGPPVKVEPYGDDELLDGEEVVV